MLKQILGVRDFRLFQDWSPEPGANDFQRVNLIYGVNGSGKSTMAALLAEAHSDSEWSSGLRLTVATRDGSTVTVRSAADSFWRNLRVFNADYVSKNLRFDLDGTSTTDPLLTLGRQQIDRDQKIRNAQARKEKALEELPALRGLASRTKKQAEDLAKTTASQIVEELSKVGGRYAARSYNARQVKQMTGESLRPADSEQIIRLLETIHAPRHGELQGPSPEKFSCSSLHVSLAELLGRTATSQVILSLRDNPDRAQWAQAGLQLHEPGDSCSFCGNMVTPEQIELLNRHFDESVTQLQSESAEMRDRILAEANSVERVLDALPKPEVVASEIRDDYATELAAVRSVGKGVANQLNALAELADRKCTELFNATEVPAELPGIDLLDLSGISELLTEHNRLISTYVARVQQAAREVEQARVYAIAEQYGDLERKARVAEAKIEELEGTVEAAERDLVGLAQEDLDATPLADSLNSDLSRLLGRDDLSFAFVGDGRYHLRREGEPATYLSEGEKTAISLLYFLKSLDAHDCDRLNTVVVIDDPVSSLDSNVIAGVSAHLWSRLVGQTKCRQVFLLTHSFELFRAWSNSLFRLNESARNAEDVTYSVLELRTRSVSSGNSSKRHPYFVSWPTQRDQRARLRSEYHYLFWRVATTLQECQEDPTPERELDAAAILPNACRRLLEGFLSFMFPGEIGDFRRLMMAAVDHLDHGVTRTRLVTFLHQYSHNEEGDISKGIPRPESINILGTAFELIREVNPQHYDRMCAALGVSPRLGSYTV